MNDDQYILYDHVSLVITAAYCLAHRRIQDLVLGGKGLKFFFVRVEVRESGGREERGVRGVGL